MGQLADRATPNQAQVLGHLRGAGPPLTDCQLQGRVRTERGKVGGAVAQPTVYRTLKGPEDARLIRRIETLLASAPPAQVSPGVMVICDDCGIVRTVEAPEVLASLHRSLATEGFAEARQTIKVHGRSSGCAGDQP